MAMKRLNPFITALAFNGIFTTACIAEDAPKNTWVGDVDVNALVTSGNSAQTSFGIGGKANYRTDSTSHGFSAFADFNKNNGVSDRERFGFGYNFRLDFSARTFFTVDGNYESNKFGAFRQRFAVAAGVGYRIYDSERVSWTAEAAPSVLFTKDIEGADYGSDFSAFGRSNLEWQLTKTTKFTNITSIHVGGRSVLENKAAFEFEILQSLSSKLSYDILHDQGAAIGRKSTDTILRAGLSYGF